MGGMLRSRIGRTCLGRVILHELVKSLHKSIGAVFIEESVMGADLAGDFTEQMILGRRLLGIRRHEYRAALHDEETDQTEVVLAIQLDVLLGGLVALLTIDAAYIHR